jgi:hypothetical protein
MKIEVAISEKKMSEKNKEHLAESLMLFKVKE